MSNKTKFYKDTKHKYEYTVNKRVIKCNAETNYLINDDVYLIKASGRAKCNPIDKFDYHFGCELAKARAKQRLAVKIEKLLKNYSNKRNDIRTDNKKKDSKRKVITEANKDFSILLNCLIYLEPVDWKY